MIYDQNIVFREIKTPVDSRTLTRIAKEKYPKSSNSDEDEHEYDSSCKKVNNNNTERIG